MILNRLSFEVYHLQRLFAVNKKGLNGTTNNSFPISKEIRTFEIGILSIINNPSTTIHRSDCLNGQNVPL